MRAARWVPTDAERDRPKFRMELPAILDLFTALLLAVFAFLIPFSTRQHRTRAAAIGSILATLLLIAYDRYLYISTGRNLIDTLTCRSVPSGASCRSVSGGAPSPIPTPTPRETATAAAPPTDAPAPVDNASPQTPSDTAAPSITRTITLDDRNATSVWVTSVYGYGAAGNGGGGMADDRLRVGGWGDTYLPLLSFGLPDKRPVVKAELVFTVKADDARSTPTPVLLGAITRDWKPGADGRVMWRDLPGAETISTLPAAGQPGSDYRIDITQLYNDWATGRRMNYGIMLSPQSTNNRYSTFYSTRAAQGVRPRLVVTF